MVALAAAWAFFLSSIWWRRVPPVGRLRTELLVAIAPERGLRRFREEQRARLLASPLPMYGLEGAADPPSLAGHGGDGEGIREISVGHPGGAWICTYSASAYGEHLVRECVESELAARRPTAQEVTGTGADGHALFVAACAEAEAAPWESGSLRIDGSEKPAMRKSVFGLAATYARMGEAWVAAIAAPGDASFPALVALGAAQREAAVDAVMPAESTR